MLAKFLDDDLGCKEEYIRQSFPYWSCHDFNTACETYGRYGFCTHSNSFFLRFLSQGCDCRTTRCCNLGQNADEVADIRDCFSRSTRLCLVCNPTTSAIRVSSVNAEYL